jgi:hypothetical protein
MNPEFGIHLFEVVFDGVMAQTQLISYFLIAQAITNQAGNIGLPTC